MSAQALLNVATAVAMGGLCVASHAADFGKAVYDGARQEVRSVYKLEREACDPQTGAAKDLCRTIADGREKIAMAYLQYSFSGLEKDQRRLYETAYLARYDIARARCHATPNDDKDVCLQSAKAERDKAKADEAFSRKVMAALNDQQAAHLKADYRLAMEQCDQRSGDDKSVCQAATKARFYDR